MYLIFTVAGTDGAIPFLVTEFCGRGDLSNVLEDSDVSWNQWFGSVNLCARLSYS